MKKKFTFIVLGVIIFSIFIGIITLYTRRSLSYDEAVLRYTGLSHELSLPITIEKIKRTIEDIVVPPEEIEDEETEESDEWENNLTYLLDPKSPTDSRTLFTYFFHQPITGEDNCQACGYYDGSPGPWSSYKVSYGGTTDDMKNVSAIYASSIIYSDFMRKQFDPIRFSKAFGGSVEGETINLPQDLFSGIDSVDYDGMAKALSAEGVQAIVFDKSTENVSYAASNGWCCLTSVSEKCLGGNSDKNCYIVVNYIDPMASIIQCVDPAARGSNVTHNPNYIHGGSSNTNISYTNFLSSGDRKMLVVAAGSGQSSYKDKKATQPNDETPQQSANNNVDMSNAKTFKSSKDYSNNPDNRSKKIVYIDPGHDGQFSGNTKGDVVHGTTSGGDGEAERVLSIGLKLRDLLEKDGYTVYMSRTTNTGGYSMGNAERGVDAARKNASMFICLHTNGTPNHNYPGCFVLRRKDGKYFNAELANNFTTRMKNETQIEVSFGGVYNKSVNCVSYFIANGGDWRGVLYVELGAHDIPSVKQYMDSTPGQNAIAKVLQECVNDYLGGA